MTSSNKTWTRIILHGDMDAFFAAVEQRDRPELRGKPLIVGGTGKRSVVSTASYEARKFGIHSAMPMAEALRRCKDAVVVPPDFRRYEAVSSVINEVFHRYSPLVEPLSLDEAFIDMTGAEGLFGSPEHMARALKRDVYEATAGLTISVGVSNTKFTAKVASDFQKPDGLTIVPADEVTSFLFPMSVSRLWGVGDKSRKLLESRKLLTIGDVAKSTKKMMESILGSTGLRIFDLARGVDSREVIPDRDAKSIGKETTFDTDLHQASQILPVLRGAADIVARSLRKEGLVASGVRVKLKTFDFQLITRQEILQDPTDSAEPLFQAAAELLGKMPFDRPIRLAGLAAFHLLPKHQGEQLGLFTDTRKERQSKLDAAMDAVKTKFGDSAVHRASDKE
jgi:DNA polymerase-4